MTGDLNLEELFEECLSRQASDIHLATDEVPRFRVGGRLLAAEGRFAATDARQTDRLAMELGLTTLPPGSPEGTERIRQTLLTEGSLDGAITSASGSRYRFNIYRQSLRTAIALRRLDATFRSLDELGLPPRMAEFSRYADGLVIMTGPTGSGKSTTLATLLDQINRMRDGHIITLEDPIEFVHQSRRSLVNQRQVGRDVKSFNDGLVEALRQDPDVLLVGEMRELATVRTAIRAAETGHLVFATLHSGDCAGAIERIVSVFPADEQLGVRRQLSLCLRGVIAQHLLKDPRNDHRHPAVEILINTPAVANLIATGRSAQIYSAIETGAAHGMRSLDESLLELLDAGLVSESAAFALTRNPESLRSRWQRGVRAAY